MSRTSVATNTSLTPVYVIRGYVACASRNKIITRVTTLPRPTSVIIVVNEQICVFSRGDADCLK